MGNFYTNFSLRGATTDEVVGFMEDTGRSGVLVSERDGWVVVCPEETEMQHPLLMEAFAKEVSATLECVVLGVLNHDDDVLGYWLTRGGELLDRYVSDPGALEGQEEPPEGGDARVLCEALGRPEAIADVSSILHPDPDADPYAYSALIRHEALVKALGLPIYTLDLGFNVASTGDLSEELDEDDLIEI